MTDQITSWDPWVYMRTHRFGRRPLILGESPSPQAPTVSWFDDAKSTRNLASVIFGAATETKMLKDSFEMRNVFETHLGRSRDGFSVFDSDGAAIRLQQESDAGLFDDRVTFFLGLRVAAGLSRTRSYEPVLSEDSRFVASHGWIDWLPVGGRSDALGLYLIVPHPQSYDLRYKPEDLVKLSALFRASFGLPPLDFPFSLSGAFASW
ncbi:hypothetical protein [Trinickia dinghuensis]|uniref:Uncharacterized protein n=1 Tax=Trinickia dinghuensis TaxID=2291023 RepID=A0A3D8JQG0_9BURK|nr:hypothetical protein [Trinickia dinghuensis]RDU94935.1 hypothetical protein DWV00_31185 [Trinickia dinghuensis]